MYCELNTTLWLSISRHKHMKSVLGWTWAEVTGGGVMFPCDICVCGSELKPGTASSLQLHKHQHPDEALGQPSNLRLSLTLAKEKKTKKKIKHINTHSLVLTHQNIQSRNIAITCIRWNTNRKSVVNVINVLMSVCSSVRNVWELLSDNYIIKCVLRWLWKAQSLIVPYKWVICT